MTFSKNNFDFIGNEVKRFYTRGTIRVIRFSRLAKIPTLYHDWLGFLN